METSLWIGAASALVTEIMTCVGAQPCLFVRKLGDRTMGWSNAAEAGLKLAAPTDRGPALLTCSSRRSVRSSPCASALQRGQ